MAAPPSQSNPNRGPEGQTPDKRPAPRSFKSAPANPAQPATRPAQGTAKPTAPQASPQPGPLQQETAPKTKSKDGTKKLVLTLLALALSVGIAVATVTLVPEEESLTGKEKTVLGAVVGTVALIGLVPMRWGWWVMAFVTLAFFALNTYNLVNPGDTVFDKYQGSSYTFGALMPMVGIAVGAAAQGLYRLVAGSE